MGNDSSIQKGIDENLRTFAQTLKAPEYYTVAGRQLCHQVCLFLTENLNYIAERNFAGSIGKKTDVIAPDFDITILVNPPHRPPFATVFDDFENLFNLNETRLNILPSSLKRGTAALSFEFTNGVSVDLVPATRLSREDIFSIMRNDPAQIYGYSSTLVKYVVGFMAEQSSFVHSMARLGKCWYKTLYFEDHVSGGSTLIELISVAVALSEEKSTVDQNELQILKKILELVGKLDSLKLVFRKVDGKWEAIWNNFQQSDFGNREISRRRFLIEPANHFNDFLDGMNPAVVQKFKTFAALTSRKLAETRAGKYINFIGDRRFIQFHLLFAPQPENLAYIYRRGIPSKYLLSYDDYSNSVYPDVRMRLEQNRESDDILHMLEAIKQNLLWTVNSVVREKPREHLSVEMFGTL